MQFGSSDMQLCHNCECLRQDLRGLREDIARLRSNQTSAPVLHVSEKRQRTDSSVDEPETELDAELEEMLNEQIGFGKHADKTWGYVSRHHPNYIAYLAGYKPRMDSTNGFHTNSHSHNFHVRVFAHALIQQLPDRGCAHRM